MLGIDDALVRAVGDTFGTSLDGVMWRTDTFVKALRKAGYELSPVPVPALTRGYLYLDLAGGECRWRGETVRITPQSMVVVHRLASSHEVVTSQRLSTALYDFRPAVMYNGSGKDSGWANLRSSIKRARRAFEEVDRGFKSIATINGYGYEWRDPRV